MVNVNKLKGKIVENGYTIEQVSAQIGINSSTFYRKLANNGESFTIGEASAIIDLLKINDKEASAIFFA